MDVLLRKLKEKNATVCIVGLGYVGLPLVIAFAEAGHRVKGIDIDSKKVSSINRGISYIQDIPSSTLEILVNNHFVEATTSFEVIKQADAVIVCVPTPVDEFHEPDLSYINQALERISQHAHQQMLVVLESTTYPGTTREVVVPYFSKTGLAIGEELFICFSPERIDPGRKDWTTYNTPKIVGGITNNCLKAGLALYESALKKVISVSSADAAEMVKILENSFRSVNIAFINEMMMIADKLNLNIWEIVEAAATKPFGYMKFTPGPGVGGHCIPVDPLYLKWKLKFFNQDAQFISLAHQINAGMPAYWIYKAEKALLKHFNKSLEDSQILVLGLAYKKDIDDMRESPSLDILKLLMQRGCSFKYHDFFVPTVKLQDKELYSENNLYMAIRQADCVILATDHSEYSPIEIASAAKLLINCRGDVLAQSEEEQFLVAN